MTKLRVPTREEWGDLKDSHVRNAYKAYGGKTVEEATALFIQDPIRGSSELLFAPAAIFNYYIHCFVSYLTSDDSREEADAASTFLNLVLSRLQKPGASEVAATILKIKPAIEKVASRQSFYDASPDIYGSFLKIKNEINAALRRFETESEKSSEI